ncbi:MAG: hypothetical protein JXQ75_17010 [Phycisphaerae bacterium]|nr:hypothetical protein [Phycisphaerae bacterium]
MKEPQQYPLSPTDNMLLAVHQSLRQRGYCGWNVMLIADVQGELERNEVAAGARQLGLCYPALSARIHFTPVSRRAYWQIAADAELEAALEYEYHKTDTCHGAVDAPLLDALGVPVDPTSSRHVRLVHVQMGEDHHRLGLCWPHYLMDLEGGHLLLLALHEVLAKVPTTLGRDPRLSLCEPYGSWSPKSFWRVWQGRFRHARYCMCRQPRIVAKPEGGQKKLGFQLRRYDARFRQRFKAVAQKRTSAGPMRHARCVMIAAALTYLDMCTERGRPREHYLYSQALPIRRAGPRPGLHGNYVTMPWVIFKRSDLTSWAAADAAALRQLTDYRRKRRDEADWEMLRAAQRWPFALALQAATHRMPRGAAGCTSYRFGDAVTRLGGAKITNLAAVGTMNCHPGWIVGDWTYGENMSIGVTYFEDFIDSPSVTEFLDRLERHLLGEAIPSPSFSRSQG